MSSTFGRLFGPATDAQVVLSLAVVAVVLGCMFWSYL
jgi:hypothetical protein